MRLPAPLGLGIGDRGMGHGLLVLATPGRQRVANAVQGLADAGDVAVAEDRPHAFDEALALFGHLHREPLDHRLRGGQTNRLAHRSFRPSSFGSCALRAPPALSQIAQSRA